MSPTRDSLLSSQVVSALIGFWLLEPLDELETPHGLMKAENGPSARACLRCARVAEWLHDLAEAYPSALF
jgi:hypothetical protein